MARISMPQLLVLEALLVPAKTWTSEARDGLCCYTELPVNR